MSGHSKWATIKHKKGALDAKRGKIFTKIIKEITVCARMGGGDVESNAKLRTVILKAKAANMPKDNIERAIKKGIGETGGADFVELSYEGYGPNGVAIMIEALTDNKNRTAADVRSVLNKGGGSLGTTGSVAYLFNRKGLFVLDGEQYSEDDILVVALESGAEDVSAEDEDGAIEVITAPEDFETVGEALSQAGFQADVAEVSLIPMTKVSLDDEQTQKVLNLVERLEDLDDVQNVFTNLNVPSSGEDEEA